MTKLKRQTISELSDRLYNAINIDASDIFSEQYCKSEDVAALEAEIAKLKAGLSDAKLPRYQPAYNDSMREPVCLDSDVVVLEAEHNQLREDLKQIREWLVPSTLNSFGNCRCHDEIESILNREQDK